MSRLRLIQEASRIAQAMLPDPRVIYEADVGAAVDDLIAYWEREAAVIGETLGNVPAEQVMELRALVRRKLMAMVAESREVMS